MAVVVVTGEEILIVKGEPDSGLLPVVLIELTVFSLKATGGMKSVRRVLVEVTMTGLRVLVEEAEGVTVMVYPGKDGLEIEPTGKGRKPDPEMLTVKPPQKL